MDRPALTNQLVTLRLHDSSTWWGIGGACGSRHVAANGYEVSEGYEDYEGYKDYEGYETQQGTVCAARRGRFPSRLPDRALGRVQSEASAEVS